ncbi:hypothetical protein [Protofrankia symbiont of Coriaria ruscifolia]|uniref:Uncharacterized protein n=1 Tax=Candidatus Protofrankia californiensis TaxID=1839754 RepID=A0A1C3PH46_9ACTN|nr:hypothetical protein [Protofrankia symbiont of Coriaria ruscifolia]SBW29129.1 hypothetical protein FDG2_6477 [Candidatus Protofrankia californiensis]
MTQPADPGGPPLSGPYNGPWPVRRSVPTDSELRARTRMLVEQIEIAQAEIVLYRAAYERATEEETADRPWLRDPVERLTITRIARALSAELDALERFRLWAEELHYLQEEARARRPCAPPAGS